MGVCALVGGNGSGKTTLLLALKLLRAVLDQDLPSAVTKVLGGSSSLASRGAEEQPVTIGAAMGDLAWFFQLIPQGGSAAARTHEVLRRGDETLFQSAPIGLPHHRGKAISVEPRLGLTCITASDTPDPDAQQIVARLLKISVFYDLDLHGLRGGSDAVQDRHLNSRGSNAVTMLRRWYQSRPDRSRYEFVLNGLRDAFSGEVSDLDFQQAGRTLVAQFYSRATQATQAEQATPMATAANGVLALLILLCAVAGAEDGGLVALDEPETALHPYAIRSFVRLAREWARQHDLTVIMSTHSPVILDEFTATPSQAYVMNADPEHPGPVALDKLRNPEWLSRFRLGELQMTDELSSNAPTQ